MKRRLSLAVLSATAVASTLLSPVAHAEETTPTPTTEVVVVTTEVEAPKGGSTFMGPMDLLRSIASGNGSSGAPERSKENPEPTKTTNPEDLPGWVRSAMIPEWAQTPLAILNLIMVVGGFVTQAAVVLLPFFPHAQQQLGDALRSMGVQV